MTADFNITFFFGRFHPVLVHLPIGILLLAFAFQLLSFTDQFRKLKSAVRPSLFLGVLSVLLAAGSGYYLSREGGYDEELLAQHKWMGFATAGLALIIYLFSRKYSFISKDDRKKAVTILFFPLGILLTWTGHLGGSITHGDDFLFPSGESLNDSIKIKRIPISNIDEAEVFNDIILPVLNEKCFACHSSKKQKGQLRLDGIDQIKKGGKHGEIFVVGNSKESELYKRLALSTEMKEHMPPKKEPQLTSVEIELIRWWINEGASFNKKGKEFSNRIELVNYVETMTEKHSQSWLPEKETAVPDFSTMKELQSSGVAIAPIASRSNYLSVSFSGRKKIEKRDLELLAVLKQQIVDLNLSWTSVSDEDLKMISELKELRWLNLGHTLIDDEGLVYLKRLENLSRLNLVETKIGDDALKTVNEIKSLKELYVFNTGITKAALLTLNSEVKIDTGNYRLPSLSTDTLIFHRKKD